MCCVSFRVFILMLLLFNWKALYPRSEMNHVRNEHYNMLGVFGGGTQVQGANFFTYGFEYHRVLSLPVGFSLIGEDTFNNKERVHERELVGLFTLNLWRNIVVGLGPGVQFIEGESQMLGRVSGGYIFLVGEGIELIPGLDYNVVHQGVNSIIYGITLGKQF